MNSFSLAESRRLYDISGVEVGQHFYWKIGGFQVHAQVIITSWVVIAILLGSAIINNFFEYVLEFIRDVSKTQIDEEYGPWVPFIGTLFLFIFVSNWSGALLPWKIIQLPHGELAAPTNDINTTLALALLMAVAYFYVGLRKKRLGYFVHELVILFVCSPWHSNLPHPFFVSLVVLLSFLPYHSAIRATMLFDPCSLAFLGLLLILFSMTLYGHSFCF
ncbi:hypothetical protein ACJW31_12G066600 [Castanea mollissima]